MTVYPVFYDAFRCTAERCRHTCCRGWEIDIDAETAARYDALPDPLGTRVRAAMDRSGETASFRLTEDERCPFLRCDGLCDLIRTAGTEEILCDVCALHPRFFTAVGDGTLAGLGLCCEEACRLLLSQTGELLFRAGEETVPLKRLTGCAFAAAQLRFAPRTDAGTCRALLERYACTEPIDGEWTQQLQALQADIPGCVRAMEAYARAYDGAAFDRIVQYVLYRQLDRLETDGPLALAQYAQDAAQFVFLLSAVTGDLPESLRRWSEQIEYSTENVDVLLS